jgi:ABC-2 type transport system permease protein
LGKTIPFIIIAQAQMIMVIVFGIVWFKIPLVGSVFLLLAASGVFLLSTLGIGLFISTVFRTQQQAMMTNFFFILPFFMFSGFVFPIANMPTIVQWLTYLNPLRYFLVIIRGIFLKGIGLEVLWPQFGSLRFRKQGSHRAYLNARPAGITERCFSLRRIIKADDRVDPALGKG